MKQLIKKSVLVLIIFMATQSYANIADSIIIENNDDKSFVKIGPLKSGSLLKIKDEAGITLHQEKITGLSQHLKSYDLSHLPDATYYFELDNDQEIRIIPILIKDQRSELIRSEEVSISKPSIMKEGSLIHVQQDGTKEQNLAVTIYFEGSEMIYEEFLKNTQAMKRTYDFSKSPKGDYTLVFNTEGRTFVNEINIAKNAK